MFGPYRREAQFLVEEGASVTAVDDALYEFGMAMGPLATGDLAGLDVGWRIRKENRHLQKTGLRQAFIEDRLCELGRFGQKTGAGWYKYNENRKPSPDPQVSSLIRQWTSEARIPQRQISAQEIVERCIYTLVNEGARILEEGIALRAVDIGLRSHLRISATSRKLAGACAVAPASSRTRQNLRGIQQPSRCGCLNLVA